MKAVGFRAEKDHLHWAVVSGTVDRPIIEVHDRLRAPKVYDVAESLAWFRDNVRAIIEQHGPSIASIRFAETFLTRKPNALASMYARARIEGVVIEAAQSMGLKVLVGSLTSISSRLGSRSAKVYVEAGDLRGLDMSGINANRKEAIVTAASALGKSK